MTLRNVLSALSMIRSCSWFALPRSVPGSVPGRVDGRIDRAARSPAAATRFHLFVMPFFSKNPCITTPAIYVQHTWRMP